MSASAIAFRGPAWAGPAGRRSRVRSALMWALRLACCAAAARDAAAQAPTWKEIGPYDAGGRVTAIAADPADWRHLVAGTPAGGLWVSRDGGLTWSPNTLWLSTVAMSAVAMSPADPLRMVVGSGSITSGGAVTAGVGTLRTVDGGASWSLERPTGSSFYVAAMLVWPGDPLRVLEATDLGVRLSLDGGAAFASAFDGDAVSAFARDPFLPDVIFATGRGGLLKSVDRGATWARTGVWPLQASDTFGAGTTAIAVSSTTPGLMYVTVQVMATLNQTSRGLLLRSTDAGRTFTSLPVPASFCGAPDSCGFGQAIALDPANDRRMLLGGDLLHVSTDGGATWTVVSGLASGVHQIVVTPGQVVIAGRSGVATLDAGWGVATPRNRGLAIAQVTSLDLSRAAVPDVLIGTADGGTLLKKGTGAWKSVFGAGEPAGPARFDPFGPLRLFASKPRGLIFRSDDGGTTFVPAQAGLDVTQPAAAQAPLEPSPLEPGVLLTGRMQTFKSADGAASWLPYLPAGFPEVQTLAPSPVVAGRTYMAPAAGGYLYKADPSTTTIERLTVTANPAARITSVFLDPAAENRLYASVTDTTAQAGGLFKSADFGATWLDITPAPLAPVTAIVKDRFGALYAAAADGVIRSANDGYTWTPFINGLFAGGATSLRIGAGFIYAGTTGRGVFRTEEQELVSIESLPSGVQMLVDGLLVTTPFLVHWEPGTRHSITPVVREDPDTRETFIGWNDGSPQVRDMTAPWGNSWMMGIVNRQFRLQASGSPAAGGTVDVSPRAPDGFYSARSFVTIIPVPANDYRFTGFTGDVGGADGVLGYAFMDRPRSVTAVFAPLLTTIRTEPFGLPIVVDGAAITAPATYQWASDASHVVSAAESVATDATRSRILAFDEWTDLGARAHAISMNRATFATDLTARYIDTVTGLSVPPGGSATLVTAGTGEAPRMAALSVSGAAAGDALVLGFIRGRANGSTTTEVPIVPSTPRTWTHAYIEDDVDGQAGQTRLVLHNPGATAARVGILLRDAGGNALAALLDGVTVVPGGRRVEMLRDLMPLPPAFRALLTLISDQPLVTAVQSVRVNRRPGTLLDPLLAMPLLPTDQGVPLDARVQTLVLTPGAQHRLVVANTGFSPLSGSLAFRDENGASLALPLEGGPADRVAYSLAPGAYLRLAFPSPAAPASGPFATGQVLVTPAAGQPAPVLQLLDEVPGATTSEGSAVLPRTIPVSDVATTFTLPVDRALRQTGAIVTNTTTLAATLTLRAVDAGGVLRGQATLVVPPQSQRVVTAASVPAVDAAFRGLVSMASDIPVFAAGYLDVVNERGEDLLAGFPLPGRAGARTFPFVADGDSWQTRLWFSNPSGSSQHLDITFSGESGQRVYLPMPVEAQR